MLFLLNECIKYNIGLTYLYTKVGHKRKQYQGQKRKKIIYKKGIVKQSVENNQERIGGKNSLCIFSLN